MLRDSSNSSWIESDEERGDFSPVELEYGQALIFDGPNLCYASVLNDVPFPWPVETQTISGKPMVVITLQPG